MIGTKTLALVAVSTVAIVVAVAMGALSPGRLASLDRGTLLVIGAFGAACGTLMFRFWRLGERSRTYFRWTREDAPRDASEGHFLGNERGRIALGTNDEGDAYDLPRGASHAVTVLVASLLALACIDGRLLHWMSGIGQGASISSSYCPEEPPPPPPAKDPNEPGCELMRRAHALGYAKSLGPCAPKKGVVRAAAPRPPCTRRQRDEPLLHYSYRLLGSFFGSVRGVARVATLTKANKDFRARLARLDSLRSAQAQMLASAPHASHHVWTNLPDPGDGAFRDATCGTRYAALPHRPLPPPGKGAPSKVLEHVLAQLLFETRYDAPAGHCREYHVHWGSPADACKRLAAAPEAFLASSAALEDVRSVLERHRVGKDLAAIGEAAGGTPKEPASVVSFQCYVEGERPERTSTPFSLQGVRFSAEEVRIAPSPENAVLYIDRYHAVAQLLVASFHYGRLLSEAGLEQAQAAGLEPTFAPQAKGAGDLLLTRAYELESIDIYLDPGFLAKRPDLLEVYPYETHLANYVQTFRRHYRRERGRL